VHVHAHYLGLLCVHVHAHYSTNHLQTNANCFCLVRTRGMDYLICVQMYVQVLSDFWEHRRLQKLLIFHVQVQICSNFVQTIYVAWFTYAMILAHAHSCFHLYTVRQILSKLGGNI
jgi:hypothetical protein